MRIGLVGYGHGGRFFHAPLLTSLPQAQLVGVVTRSAERRQLLAVDHPGIPAYDSLGQLVEAGVDLIVISTTLQGRPALVHEALELGIAVVSDKPFAMDANQARELIAAAERQQVPLTVYQNRRWDSDFLTVRKVIASGALGDIRLFDSRVERYVPHSVGDPSGGGALRDLGSHLVDQALLLFGPVARVYAELHYTAPAQQWDHGFFVSLEHRNGVTSHLRSSNLQDGEPGRFRVTGSTGTFRVDGLDVQSEAVLAGLSPRSEGERWGVEEHRRWGWLEHAGEGEKVPSERGNWPAFYQQVQQALQAGTAMPVNLADVLQTTLVLDAARLSFERRQVVPLETQEVPEDF
jgi:predicted dehydrogenase